MMNGSPSGGPEASAIQLLIRNTHPHSQGYIAEISVELEF